MVTMTTIKQCPQFSLLRLTGADTLNFINNQIINKFDDGVAIPHYSAICNPKGRILFSLLIWPDEDGLVIAVDKSLVSNLSSYINMRRFRMQLTCDLDTTLAVVFKPNAEQTLSAFSLTDQSPQQELTDAEFWAIFFDAQLPWINELSTELFIPQHLSLDDHGLIEYQKGCYPGQEVIARLHFLGKVKKHMSLENIESNESLNIGDKVILGDGTEGQLCSPIINLESVPKAQVVKSVKAI